MSSRDGEGKVTKVDVMGRVDNEIRSISGRDKGSTVTRDDSGYKRAGVLEHNSIELQYSHGYTPLAYPPAPSALHLAQTQCRRPAKGFDDGLC